MKIYLFVSEPQSVRAFTADATGANLPSNYAPWSVLDTGADSAARGPVDRVSTMVRRDGYFLLSGKGNHRRGQSMRE